MDTLVIKNIWHKYLKFYFDRRIAVIFFLGFSCGIPLLLTASTFNIWLAQNGIKYHTIGFMTLITLPYTCKFLWAPCVDRLPIPFFTKWLGQRRSWLFTSQLILILSILCLGLTSPRENLKSTAIFAFIVSFAAATQKIVMLVYQVERLQSYQYGVGEAAGIFGYRLGILTAGAGALYLSEFFMWSTVYAFMSLTILIGIMTTLICHEPDPTPTSESILLREQSIDHYLLQKTHLKKWQVTFISQFYKTVIFPFTNFKTHPEWIIILFIMFFYKLGDDMICTMKNLFYLDLGFSKTQIANSSKIFGMAASIIGGLIGGIVTVRLGMIRSLFFLAIIHAVAMFGYLFMSYIGPNIRALYLTIALENITGAMRLTAFYAYQLTLCSPQYAATQLALLTSIVHMGHVICSTPSGWIIEQVGWDIFFLLSIVANIPALVLILWFAYKLDYRLFNKKLNIQGLKK